MKTISLKTDRAEFDELMHQIIESQWDIVLWQKPPRCDERQIFFTHLEHSGDILEFSPPEKKVFSQLNGDIYFFCQAAQLIFKTSMRQSEEYRVDLELPAECKLLNQKEAYAYVEMVRSLSESLIQNPANMAMSFRYAQTHMRGKMSGTDNVGPQVAKITRLNQGLGPVSQGDFDLSMKDIPYSEREESKYAAKREAPRARPKDDKKVWVRKNQQLQALEFSLFDLSQGGLSFIIDSADMFEKEEVIDITNLDQKQLDPPLVGKVASIRPIDQTSSFKVGVMFISDDR